MEFIVTFTEVSDALSEAGRAALTFIDFTWSRFERSTS